MYRFKTVGELRRERQTLREDWVKIYSVLFQGKFISDQMAEEILAPKYKQYCSYSVSIDFYVIENNRRLKHSLVVEPEDITEKEHPGILRRRLFPFKKVNVKRRCDAEYVYLGDALPFKV